MWKFRLSEESRGIAVLAVFTVLVILSSAIAAETFRQAYSEKTRTFQLSSAMSTVRATASSIELELSEALRMAIVTAMYESGRQGEVSSEIKEKIISYINSRIQSGWEYSGFRQIVVYPIAENSLNLMWLPDGSLRISVFIPSRLVHVSGAEVIGLRVEAGASPRYLRLEHLARLAEEMLENTENSEDLEKSLNENYACEYILFRIFEDEIIVVDLYGGEVIVK
ncbi:MAG: hypothetical protein QXU01_03390 [Candidatus Hadarchaeales archaeon]